jgi:hypothetical protein
MSETPIPALEPDADTVTIFAAPSDREPGAITFARDLARHLEQLLHASITKLVYRANPCDRRPCPRVQTYELDIGDHHIVITCYETSHPLIRGPVPEQAVVIDAQRIPFERPAYLEPLEWQLARAIWIAITDREMAAHRDEPQA